MRLLFLSLLLVAGCYSSAAPTPSGKQIIITKGSDASGRAVVCTVELMLDFPTPPTPPPVDPLPTDAFSDTVHFVYGSEKSPDSVKALAQVYREAVTKAKDPTFQTAGSLFTSLRKARLDAIGEDLPKTRAVITAELDKTLPTIVAAPLTEEVRRKAVEVFTRVAVALETCK